jgi:hypothetical protein
VPDRRLQIFPGGFFGFTEVIMAIVLVVILIYRPTGIMGSRELRWPGRRRLSPPVEGEPVRTRNV